MQVKLLRARYVERTTNSDPVVRLSPNREVRLVLPLTTENIVLQKIRTVRIVRKCNGVTCQLWCSVLTILYRNDPIDFSINFNGALFRSILLSNTKKMLKRRGQRNCANCRRDYDLITYQRESSWKANFIRNDHLYHDLLRIDPYSFESTIGNNSLLPSGISAVTAYCFCPFPVRFPNRTDLSLWNDYVTELPERT